MAQGKAHKVTPETKAQVAALVSFGVIYEDIATYMGISHDTLTRKYKHELETSAVKANAAVANRLFNKATVDNDLTAMIFWLKTRARWREKDRNESDQIVSIAEKLIDKLSKDDKKPDKPSKSDKSTK